MSENSSLYLSHKVNEQNKVNVVETIPSYEVADMMNKSHAEVLYMIEGRKDKKGNVKIKGIIPTLEIVGEFQVSDYFIKTTYTDSMNREKECYECTKLGCDLLANKMTGEKGILFSARYVKKFNQMQEVIQNNTAVATISDETIKRITEPFCLMIQQQSETLNTVAKTVEMVVNNQKKQEEEIKKLEAKIVQESSMKKFEDLAEKQFKEQCKTDTRTMRNQFMAEVDVKCIHLDRALKPAELAKYYKKDSKEFNSWLQSIGLQYKEAGCWVIAQKYKDQGYSDTFTGPYGTYLGWTLKGCILIYDLLAARGKYPQIQEAFER